MGVLRGREAGAELQGREELALLQHNNAGCRAVWGGGGQEQGRTGHGTGRGETGRLGSAGKQDSSRRILQVRGRGEAPPATPGGVPGNGGVCCRWTRERRGDEMRKGDE